MLAKLGIFLLVHVIPSAVRVACLLYDVTDERLLRHNCLLDDVTMTEVLMTETAMSTLTGLVSGVFVMTSRLSDVTSSQPTSGVDDVIIDCRVDRVVAEGNNRIRYDPIGKRRELHQLILWRHNLIHYFYLMHTFSSLLFQISSTSKFSFYFCLLDTSMTSLIRKTALS